MKKIISLVLALCMVFSVSVSAFAATISTKIEETTIDEGETLKVTLNLNQHLIGVKMLETRFYYNPQLFEYPTSAVNSSNIVLGAKEHKVSDILAYATLNFVDKDSAGQVFNAGDFYVLNLKAKTGMSENKAVTNLEFKIQDCENTSQQNNFVAGGEATSVTVSKKLPTLTATADKTRVLTRKEDTISASNRITVTLGLKNNDALAAIGTNLVYDKSVLVLEKVEDSGKLGNYTENFNYTENSALLMWGGGATNVTDETIKLATATFAVVKDVEPCETSIEFIMNTEKGSNNENGEDVIWEKAPVLTISIIDNLQGDVNEDGVVNLKDVTRLLRILANLETVYSEVAADVNIDGKVNLKDITRLLRALANLDPFE